MAIHTCRLHVGVLYTELSCSPKREREIPGAGDASKMKFPDLDACSPEESTATCPHHHPRAFQSCEWLNCVWRSIGSHTGTGI